MFLFVISGLILLIYSLLILLFHYGWHKLGNYKTNAKLLPSTKVSILIAVRNEASNIANLLNAIINQDYKKELYEIIIINDHSEDETIDIVKEFQRRVENIILLNCKEAVYGKKYAIKYGIEHSKWNLIITVDADCRLDNQWLSTIVSFYELHKPQMIVCPVLMHNETTFFERMQSLDFISLAGSTGGALGINLPIMCNGANLVFEKKIYLKYFDIADYKYASGDDMFLMMKVKSEKQNKIMYLKSTYAIAKTYPEKTWKRFINQRIRWASKAKYYSDKWIILVSAIVYLSYFFMLILFIGSWFNKIMLMFFLLFFISKCIVDFLFLKSITAFFKKKQLLNMVVPTQFFNIFYINYVTIVLIFKKFVWKGRVYKI